MKWQEKLIGILFISFILDFFTINALGNPVLINPIENPVIKIFYLIFIFIIGTGLEYLILKQIEIIVRSESKGLFRSFFKVNLVTFPLTQILAYIVYIYLILFYWFYILIIEIFVVLVEWVLLKIDLSKTYGIYVNSKRFLFQVGLANCGSFLLGLLLFIPSTF